MVLWARRSVRSTRGRGTTAAFSWRRALRDPAMKTLSKSLCEAKRRWNRGGSLKNCSVEMSSDGGPGGQRGQQWLQVRGLTKEIAASCLSIQKFDNSCLGVYRVYLWSILESYRAVLESTENSTGWISSFNKMSVGGSGCFWSQRCGVLGGQERQGGRRHWRHSEGGFPRVPSALGGQEVPHPPHTVWAHTRSR